MPKEYYKDNRRTKLTIDNRHQTHYNGDNYIFTYGYDNNSQGNGTTSRNDTRHGRQSCYHNVVDSLVRGQKNQHFCYNSSDRTFASIDQTSSQPYEYCKKNGL